MRRYALPAPADIVFILFALALPLTRGYQALNTDGDLGRHLRVGETILAERGLFYTDRFSHTMAGEPFVPYEWLSEVLFALSYRLGGLGGVLALSALIAAAAYALVARFLERNGTDPFLAFLTAIAAGAIGAVHWLARPHLFTLLGAVLLLWLLERGRRGSPALTAALFAIWANLHGGFLYGLVLIALYIAGDALEWWNGVDRADAAARLRGHGMHLAAACVGATLNPSGLGLFPHVVGYLGKSYLVDNTAEYQSPDFHDGYGRLFLVVLLGSIGALALSRRRMPFPRLAVLLANAAFALVSIRNIPLFGLTALPLVVSHVDPEWRALRLGIVGRLRDAFAAVSRAAGVGAWSIGAAVVLLAIAPSIPAWFDRSVFPIDAVRQARAAGLHGHLFNEFAWGGYVLHAWPEQRVFIDGQTDFYGERLTQEYAALRSAAPGWRDALTRRRVRMVLLPPGAPLVAALRRSGWSIWYRDSTAVLLQAPEAPL